MRAKNNNYYRLDVFNSFPKGKFYQDFNMNNYMINKKSMFIPKKFNMFTFFSLFPLGLLLAIMISGLSFFIVLPFSHNSESASDISFLIMEYLCIILTIFTLYLSFVLSTDYPHKEDYSLYVSVKKKNTSYFGQEEYDLVKKNCPEELEKWVSAIIDYGETTSNEAKTYADNIVKTAQQRENGVPTHNMKK